MEIDASQAIAKLGINHPVRFVPSNLNGPFGAEIAFALQGVVDARTDAPGFVVEYDQDAMRITLEDGGPSPETLIAHELVHVRQMMDIPGYPDADAVNESYRKAGGMDGLGNYANPFEVDAYQRQDDYADGVHITW